jgi:hypothetical protein
LFFLRRPGQLQQLVDVEGFTGQPGIEVEFGVIGVEGVGE